MELVAEPSVLFLDEPTSGLDSDFLLLGKGGKVVYMGPRELAPQYFAGIGFECPPDESESDFFMDVVSGRKKSSFDPYFKLTDLFHCIFEYSHF